MKHNQPIPIKCLVCDFFHNWIKVNKRHCTRPISVPGKFDMVTLINKTQRTLYINVRMRGILIHSKWTLVPLD